MDEAGWMARIPEPERMDLPEEARAYAVADFSEVNAAFVARLLELADALADANAVDLGTGPGDIPLRLAAARPAWRITGLDAAHAMLLHARDAARSAKSRPPFFVEGCAARAPFESGAFDLVFSNSILHHVLDPQLFWREVRRLVRPGGMVFLRDLRRLRTPAEARRVVRAYAANETALLQEEFYRSLLAAYTPEEVRAQLDAADLHGLQVDVVSDRHLDAWGRVA
jgi:ubiquinone/menaquinone biosynthesis C-methylase UbiE